MVTFGLAIIIQNALLLEFSADEQGLDAGRLETASIRISSRSPSAGIPRGVRLAVAIVAGVQLLLNRTKMGRAFRATSDDREAAELMGMNNRHIYSLAMACPWPRWRSAASPWPFAPRSTRPPARSTSSSPSRRSSWGAWARFWGTLLGGVVLGLAQTLGAQAFGTGWGILCGHVVFLIVLAVQPSGFFARTVTA